MCAHSNSPPLQIRGVVHHYAEDRRWSRHGRFDVLGHGKGWLGVGAMYVRSVVPNLAHGSLPPAPRSPQPPQGKTPRCTSPSLSTAYALTSTTRPSWRCKTRVGVFRAAGREAPGPFYSSTPREVSTRVGRRVWLVSGESLGTVVVGGGRKVTTKVFTTYLQQH